MKNLLGDWFRSVELNSAHAGPERQRSEEHTSELQSQSNLVCRLLLEKKKKQANALDPVLVAKFCGDSAREPGPGAWYTSFEQCPHTLCLIVVTPLVSISHYAWHAPLY